MQADHDQQVGGYDQSLSNLCAGNFPTTQVQLRVSLPIRNRTTEASLSRSIAEGRRIKNQKEQFEQAIEADVRNAMQGVRSVSGVSIKVSAWPSPVIG